MRKVVPAIPRLIQMEKLESSCALPTNLPSSAAGRILSCGFAAVPGSFAGGSTQ